jgi:hypothetical protein
VTGSAAAESKPQMNADKSQMNADEFAQPLAARKIDRRSSTVFICVHLHSPSTGGRR